MYCTIPSSPEGNKPRPQHHGIGSCIPTLVEPFAQSPPPPPPSHTMTWTFFPTVGGGGDLRVGKLQLWIEREIVTFAFEASSVHRKPPLPPPSSYKSAFQFLQQQQISAYMGHLQL
jgi:hypothetical protein